MISDAAITRAKLTYRSIYNIRSNISTYKFMKGNEIRNNPYIWLLLCDNLKLVLRMHPRLAVGWNREVGRGLGNDHRTSLGCTEDLLICMHRVQSVMFYSFRLALQ
jgi:hypothetical protein